MDKILDISAFTPSQMSPEDRSGIFVQRHALLADAVARVKESAETGNNHHLLFVGPRGSGKTLFVSLVVDRIAEDPQLAKKLHVAWLNEDETSTTFLDLLLRIYRALTKRYPKVYHAESMEPLYDLNPNEMEGFATNTLLQRLNNHTPLIVVENLDRIFQGIKDEGQKKLRAFFQEHPIFAIVATAQTLISDLTSRTGPFYGFFQTEHLKPLSLEDSLQLLTKIAKQKKDRKLTSFLKTPKGRARGRALHFLTGGNHRVFIVLAQFITHDTIDSLVKPFLKMVDELTPYYQERVRALPDLQCKIIEYLCTCVETIPVKTIARRMLTTHQSVSSQLKELREKGYVRSHKKGREYLYEVSEPMMRICVEVKENQTRTLGLLVDFIRVWFEAGELTTRRGLAKAGSLDEIYFQAACDRTESEGNLRHQILVENLCTRLEQTVSEEIATEISPTLETIPEELALATECLLDGNKTGALEESLESGKISDPGVLDFRGQIFSLCGESEKAIADYTAVTELPNAPTDQVASALFNRGFEYGLLGESEKEVTDYTAVIKHPNAPTNLVASALINRGVTHGELRESSKAITDYTGIIELPNAPTNQVAVALYNRGFTHGELGESERAITDFTAVIEIPNAPKNIVAKALLVRGITHSRMENFTQANYNFEQLLSDDDLPVELSSDLYLRIAELRARQGRWEEAFDQLSDSLEITPKPVEKPDFDLVELLDIFALAGLGKTILEAHVRKILKIAKKHEFLVELGNSLLQHISGLTKSKDSLDPVLLKRWGAIWTSAGRGFPDLDISLRMLRSGIAYLASKDRNESLLLNLKSEERNLLRQTLGLDQDKE